MGDSMATFQSKSGQARAERTGVEWVGRARVLQRGNRGALKERIRRAANGQDLSRSLGPKNAVCDNRGSVAWQTSVKEMPRLCFSGLWEGQT